MNFITIGVGIAAAIFGIITIVIRIKKPSSFKKLEPMQNFWGKKLGYIIHFVGYSLVPIGVGIFFIFSGIHGGAIY